MSISKSKIAVFLGTLALVALTTGCKKWECGPSQELTDLGCGTVELCYTSDDTEAKFTYDGKDYVCDGVGKNACDAAGDELLAALLEGCGLTKQITKADLLAAMAKVTPGTCGGL